MASELAKMYMAYGKGRTIPVEQQEQEQTAPKPFTPTNVFFPMAGGYNLPQLKSTPTEQSLLTQAPVTPAPIVQPTVEQPLEQIQEAFKAESIESPITKQEEEKVLQDPVALRKYSKAGNMFARFGGFQEAPEELLTRATPEELNIYNKQKLQARNQGIGEMLLMLSDAFGGRDIAMRALERQQISQQGVQSEQQIQRLKAAGFSDQEINMILAGLDPKDVMDFRKTDMSGANIIENVEKNIKKTTEETGVLDTFANIDQAFGPIDATQEALSRATRVLGFDVDPLQSGTGAAVRARNSLNTEILANLAADFTGRPNMLIYENIKGNLPMTAATSEKDAREKYENIKDQVDARINNLKQGLESSILDDKTKNSYRDELNKSLLLSKKLDSAILSLKGKKEETLEPSDFGFSGKYQNLYLDNG